MAGNRGGVAADYVSPHTRWALLRDDYPRARYTFDFATGSQLGIPKDWGGGDTQFITCTIDLGDGTEPMRAWREIDVAKTAENLTVLRTKALGRATRMAGYPDRKAELSSVLMWRQRKHEMGEAMAEEISANVAGALPVTVSTFPATQALNSSSAYRPAIVNTQAALEDALSAAAVEGSDEEPPADPDEVAAEPDIEPDADPDTGEITGGPHLPLAPDGPPTDWTYDSLVAAFRAAFSGLSAAQQKAVRAWTKANSVNMSEPGSFDKAMALLAHVQSIVNSAQELA